MPKGTTRNATRYVDILMKLHPNIEHHWKGRLNAGIAVLHNTRPYTVRLTQSMLMTLKIKVLTHPAYSPGLSPCDYEVFSLLKKFLEVKCFSVTKRSKKRSGNECYKLGQNFEGV